jgi:hypothetical protein
MAGDIDDGGVVSLDDARLKRQRHRAGPAVCRTCGYTWIAVHPVTVLVLECPRCHTLTGDACEEVLVPLAFVGLSDAALSLGEEPGTVNDMDEKELAEAVAHDAVTSPGHRLGALREDQREPVPFLPPAAPRVAEQENTPLFAIGEAVVLASGQLVKLLAAEPSAAIECQIESRMEVIERMMRVLSKAGPEGQKILALKFPFFVE